MIEACDDAARRRWMSVLALAPTEDLETAWSAPSGRPTGSCGVPRSGS